jgi:hypothetical protein
MHIDPFIVLGSAIIGLLVGMTGAGANSALNIVAVSSPAKRARTSSAFFSSLQRLARSLAVSNISSTVSRSHVPRRASVTSAHAQIRSRACSRCSSGLCLIRVTELWACATPGP